MIVLSHVSDTPYFLSQTLLLFKFLLFLCNIDITKVCLTVLSEIINRGIGNGDVTPIGCVQAICVGAITRLKGVKQGLFYASCDILVIQVGYLLACYSLDLR